MAGEGPVVQLEQGRAVPVHVEAPELHALRSDRIVRHRKIGGHAVQITLLREETAGRLHGAGVDPEDGLFDPGGCQPVQDLAEKPSVGARGVGYLQRPCPAVGVGRCEAVCDQLPVPLGRHADGLVAGSAHGRQQYLTERRRRLQPLHSGDEPPKAISQSVRRGAPKLHRRGG